MSYEYDYLVEISGWANPGRFAGRGLTYLGNFFKGILLPTQQSIVSSADPSQRSSAVVALTNDGGIVAQHLANSMAGLDIDILRLERGAALAELVYRGTIDSVSYSEKSLNIVAVEHSLSRSRRLDIVVGAATWPRARPSDIGASIPVPIGTVPDVLAPMVAWNPGTRLAESVTAPNVVGVQLEDANGFPPSGTIRIGDEKIGYSSISPSGFLEGIARGISSSEAEAHEQGDAVVSVANFDIGIDASGSASTVIAAVAIGDNDERIPAPLPSSYPTVNGATMARWGETPTYEQPTGEMTVSDVGIDTDAGSTPILQTPERWMEGDPEYAYEAVRYIGMSITNIAKGRRAAVLRRLGAIKKVLVEVRHSGDKTLAVSGFDSTLGTTTIYLDGILIGTLENNDLIDSDYSALVGHPQVFANGAGATGPQTTTHIIHLFSSTVPALIGGAFTRAENVADFPNMIDGSGLTFARFGAVYTSGIAYNELNFYTPTIPGGVPGDAVLDRVFFSVAHGGNGELNGFASAHLEIREGVMLIEAGPTFPSRDVLVARSIDSANPGGLATWIANGGLGRTVAELAGLRFIFLHESGSILAVHWAVNDASTRLTYHWDAAAETSNPLINQYDITSLLPPGLAWSDLLQKTIEIRADAVSTSLRIFLAGFRVLYTPTQQRPVKRLALTISSALKGDPASIINALWTGANYGANAAATIDAGEVAAASVRALAEGYDSSAVGGLIRSEGLWETVQQIASECRLQVYVLRGVLRMEYLELIADVPAAASTLQSSGIRKRPGPSFSEEDASQGVANSVLGKHSYTDLDGFVGLPVKRQDAGSIASFGEKLQEISFMFLRGDAAANKTIDAVLDRQASPQVSARIPADLMSRSILEPLAVLQLELGWISVAKFQAIEIAENGSHGLDVRGIILLF